MSWTQTGVNRSISARCGGRMSPGARTARKPSLASLRRRCCRRTASCPTNQYQTALDDEPLQIVQPDHRSRRPRAPSEQLEQTVGSLGNHNRPVLVPVLHQLRSRPRLTHHGVSKDKHRVTFSHHLGQLLVKVTFPVTQLDSTTAGCTPSCAKLICPTVASGTV